mgnify:CR=1 FL=1
MIMLYFCFRQGQNKNVKLYAGDTQSSNELDYGSDCGLLTDFIGKSESSMSRNTSSHASPYSSQSTSKSMLKSSTLLLKSQIKVEHHAEHKSELKPIEESVRETVNLGFDDSYDERLDGIDVKDDIMDDIDDDINISEHASNHALDKKKKVIKYQGKMKVREMDQHEKIRVFKDRLISLGNNIWSSTNTQARLNDGHVTVNCDSEGKFSAVIFCLLCNGKFQLKATKYSFQLQNYKRHVSTIHLKTKQNETEISFLKKKLQMATKKNDDMKTIDTTRKLPALDNGQGDDLGEENYEEQGYMHVYEDLDSCHFETDSQLNSEGNKEDMKSDMKSDDFSFEARKLARRKALGGMVKGFFSKKLPKPVPKTKQLSLLEMFQENISVPESMLKPALENELIIEPITKTTFASHHSSKSSEINQNFQEMNQVFEQVNDCANDDANGYAMGYANDANPGIIIVKHEVLVAQGNLLKFYDQNGTEVMLESKVHGTAFPNDGTPITIPVLPPFPDGLQLKGLEEPHEKILALSESAGLFAEVKKEIVTSEHSKALSKVMNVKIDDMLDDVLNNNKQESQKDTQKEDVSKKESMEENEAGSDSEKLRETKNLENGKFKV